MTNSFDVVVLGSGISGLASTFFAKQKNLRVACYTKDSRHNVGGLCSSFKIGEFTFDNAVHLSFAKENEVRSLFDKVPHYKHNPLSFNFDRSNWLKHPVQNNLFPLSTMEKVKIIDSFVSRPIFESYTNYYEWLVAQYGEYFANFYPIKYTKKYWSIGAKDMGVDWVGNRMNKLQLSEMLKGAFEELDENHYYTQEMRYPKTGGYQSFIQELIDETNCIVHFDHTVEEIDAINKQVYFKNGEVVNYKKLVSSIPLPELIATIKDVDKEMLSISQTLFATSVDLISVGFSRVVTDKLWFYIYDEDILAARAYAPHVKSPANVPSGCSSLQFEIYSSVRSQKIFSIEEMKENVINALEEMQIASKEDILFIEHKRLPYGNVVFDLGMEERRDTLLSYVRELDIEPIGRFGLWDYLWSNQAFMSGYNAISKLSKE